MLSSSANHVKNIVKYTIKSVSTKFLIQIIVCGWVGSPPPLNLAKSGFPPFFFPHPKFENKVPPPFFIAKNFLTCSPPFLSITTC